jgi:hypothetical protein
MSLSVWSVIKNERQFIGYGLMSVLPYADEVIYFDGNSTDGTLELLDYIKGTYDKDNKIKVFRDKDFKDFKEDYTRVFDECLKTCTKDHVMYLHPDMIVVDPGNLQGLDKKVLAYYVNMRSFAGEDLDLEITKGRTDKWKTIMRNRFGLHYHGFYGAQEEDMYFGDITGTDHKLFKDFGNYPFVVQDSGAKIWHFCECKPLQRREEKMYRVITTSVEAVTHGCMMEDDVHVWDAVKNHPRVHLQTQSGVFGSFMFEPRKDPLPDVFSKYKEEFEKILGGK